MDKAASAGHSDRCRIVVDTCCDFSPEVAANLDVDILGFPFIIDGEERTDDIWSSITPKEFYDRMRAGAVPTTSAINEQNYIDYFEPVLQEGKDIYYITFSHKLSATFESMDRAIAALKEKYPDRVIRGRDMCLSARGGTARVLIRSRAGTNS